MDSGLIDEGCLAERKDNCVQKREYLLQPDLGKFAIKMILLTHFYETEEGTVNSKR